MSNFWTFFIFNLFHTKISIYIYIRTKVTIIRIGNTSVIRILSIIFYVEYTASVVLHQSYICLSL